VQSHNCRIGLQLQSCRTLARTLSILTDFKNHHQKKNQISNKTFFKHAATLPYQMQSYAKIRRKYRKYFMVLSLLHMQRLCILGYHGAIEIGFIITIM